MPLTHKESGLIGIHDETHSLNRAAIWGNVGSEAVLAQLFPPEISLFHGQMNVLKAREEGNGYGELLEAHGVEVIRVRDELAKIVKPRTLSREGVLGGLIGRAGSLQEDYKTQAPSNIDDILEELLDQDIERYGEGPALALNRRLSLSKMPLGNLMYARDQMNVLIGLRVVSEMAKLIRKREVGLYEEVYQQLLHSNGDQNFYQITGNDTFEGGDAYLHSGVIYIGVGARTTRGAAYQIYEALGDAMEEYGMRMAIVEDPDCQSRSQKEQMDFMHLDTFSAPVGRRQMLITEQEGRRRRVSFIEKSGRGAIVAKDTGRNFIDHLESEGEEVFYTPEGEEDFATNYLLLNEETVAVPLVGNSGTTAILEKAGKLVIQANLDESTKGYGAAHCMTGQLHRGYR